MEQTFRSVERLHAEHHVRVRFRQGNALVQPTCGVTGSPTFMTDLNSRYEALSCLLIASGVEPGRVEKIIADIVIEDRLNQHEELQKIKECADDMFRQSSRLYRRHAVESWAEQRAKINSLKNILFLLVLFNLFYFILSFSIYYEIIKLRDGEYRQVNEIGARFQE